MSNRTCDIAGCERAHRARGLCVTHYNQQHQTHIQRHRTETRACVVCATQVVRRVENHHQPTCSVACRTIVQHGQEQAQHSAYDWRTDAKKRARDNGCTTIEDFDRVEVFERDGWACQLCGITCEQPNPYRLRSATVDHVIAYANGGQHALANVQTACLRCNASKQATNIRAA